MAIIPHNNIKSLGQDDKVINLNNILPSVSVSEFRDIFKVDDIVSNAKITSLLELIMAEINTDIHIINNINKEQIVFYKNAVYYRAKAALNNEYRDIDTTADGAKKSNDLEKSADWYLKESRKYQRLLGGKNVVETDLI